MAPTITTPVKGFTGIVAGVAFANGVGETEDPIALGYFERRGYGIEGADAPEVVEIPDGDPVEAWTKKQLDAYAVREELDVGNAKSKPDIVAALIAAKAEKVAKAAEAAAQGDSPE